MIDTALIARLKRNLILCADKFPATFCYGELNGYFQFNAISKGSLLVYYNSDDTFITIDGDPKQEFSNAIARIYFETFGDDLVLDYRQTATMSGWKRYFCFWDGQFTRGLTSKTELSAQIEALCIKIEEIK